MNACDHMASYYEHWMTVYRVLHWWRSWEMARSEIRRYRELSVGIVED